MNEGLSLWSSVKTVFPLQEAWVPSLVGELTSKERIGCGRGRTHPKGKKQMKRKKKKSRDKRKLLVKCFN